MPEFEVDQSGVCSICGEEKEAEELSELDGQIACLDCIAEARASDIDIPPEQIAASIKPTPQSPKRSFNLPRILIYLFFIAGAGGIWWHAHRINRQDDDLRKAASALKSQGDVLERSGRHDEALAKYEQAAKQLVGTPLLASDLVDLFHQTQRAASGPYHKIILPRLESIESTLRAGRTEEARQQFRELAAFINAHPTRPQPAIRQRIDRVTDQLKIPTIASANWRKEIPTVTLAPRQTQPAAQPLAPPQAIATPTPTPQPTVTQPVPRPPSPKSIEPVSVPDTTSQARAEEQIRARFADKYAQRDALARRALAHLLFITAQDPSNDSTTRFVLLRESRDIAIRVAEPRIALAAIDLMAKSFLVSDVAMRVKTLAECAQNAFTAEANELIAETGLDLADRMAAENHYDEAYRCAVIANTAAQQSRQPTLIAQTAAKLKELKR
jgi:hypothetical protein